MSIIEGTYLFDREKKWIKQWKKIAYILICERKFSTAKDDTLCSRSLKVMKCLYEDIMISRDKWSSCDQFLYDTIDFLKHFLICEDDRSDSSVSESLIIEVTFYRIHRAKYTDSGILSRYDMIRNGIDQ